MTFPDNDPFDRKSQIERLRASQHNDNDWFFDKFDQTLNSGAKGFAKLAGVALIVNLVFWLTIIAAVIFGLSLVF